MKEVYILRGPSGSGKSTWIAENHESALVCSSDHFFMVDGEYQFDISKLSMNHSLCFKKFIDAILKGVETVIVDNTNIFKWQYESYAVLAEKFGYQVTLVELMPVTIEELRTVVARNAHGVPQSTVCQMVLDFETDCSYTTLKRGI